MAESTGLYGSSVGANMARSSIAEFVGTFVLVFTGTAVASAAVVQRQTAGPAYDSLAIGLAFGLALVAVVAAIGHVSGAHVNPAVTVSLAAIRKFPWKYVPAYVASQVAGAVCGALATWATLGRAAHDQAHLGAPAPAAGVGVGQAFLAEALITFLLVFVVVSVATDERVDKAIAPLAVGFALACGVLIAGPATGGAVNPARALGPMIVAGTFDSWWLYIAGPILGGVLAAFAYNALLADAKDPSEELSREKPDQQQGRRRPDGHREQNRGQDRARRPRRRSPEERPRGPRGDEIDLRGQRPPRRRPGNGEGPPSDHRGARPPRPRP